MTRRPPPVVRRSAGPAGAARAGADRGAAPPEQVTALPETGPALRDPGQRDPGQRDPDQRDPGQRDPGQAAAGTPARAGRSVTGSALAGGASSRPLPRRRRRRWWPAAAVVVLFVALGAVLLLTPLTAVRTVEASGQVRTPAAQVVAAGSSQVGRPLLRVDAGAVRRASATLPWVRGVQLERRWPHTLVVRVREATAVAALRSGGRYALVDGRGRTIVVADAVPDGVPLVSVDVATAGAGALRAASAVADGLPGALRSRVTGITALSGQDVRLTLRDGAQVRWGSAGRTALKARVLAALLGRHATGYDVSAPEAPATS